MKNKILVGIIIAIFYIIIIKLGKIKLLYNIVLNLSILELSYIFIKHYKTSKYNIIFFIISISKIVLCKYLLKKRVIPKKELNKLLINTCLNDIFQELIGKTLGKTKITKISPNKTLEGYLGGCLTSLIYGKIIFKQNIKYSTLIYVSNIIGDLYFSYVKRLYGIKDFSRLLLDHGGLLDRFDSLILATITHILTNNIANIKVVK